MKVTVNVKKARKDTDTVDVYAINDELERLNTFSSWEEISATELSQGSFANTLMFSRLGIVQHCISEHAFFQVRHSDDYGLVLRLRERATWTKFSKHFNQSNQ